MRVYRVVYDQDGETTTEPGMKSTEINRIELRYAAEHISEVLDAIEWLLNDEEKTVIAIIEEAPSITVLGSNVKLRGCPITEGEQKNER